MMLIEVKCNQKGYQKATKQLFDGKERIEEVFSSLGTTTKWKYIGVFYAQLAAELPLFDCEPCSTFAIVGEDQIPEKMEAIGKLVTESHENGEFVKKQQCKKATRV